MTRSARRVWRGIDCVAVGMAVASVASSTTASAKPGPSGTSTTTTTSAGRVTIFGSSGGGIFGGSSFLHRIGTRDAPSGVTVRVYEASFPSPTGTAFGPSGPIPGACFPDRQLVVEYSTTDVAGQTSFASRHDQPYAPQGQLVGVAENKPIGVVTALVPTNSQRAVMRFTGGQTDTATPLSGGWVVFASPVRSPAFRHPVPLLTDRAAPLGRLSVIDHRGREHSLGTVTPGGGISAVLAICQSRGASSSPLASAGTVPATGPPLTLPAATGPPPADEAAARQAIEAAYHRLFAAKATATNESPDLQGGPALSEAQRQQLQKDYGDITGKLKVRVNDFRFLSPTEAVVNFDLLLNGQAITATTVGRAVLENGRWKVAKATFCDIIGRGGIRCL